MLNVLLLLALPSLAVCAGDFTVVAHLKHRNVSQLEETFWNVATPGNKDYLKHLSVSDLADVIGSSASDISSVEKWLTSTGGSSVEVSPLRDSVSAVFESDTHSLTLGSFGVPVKDSRRPDAVSFVLRRDHGASDSSEAAKKQSSASARPTIKSTSNPTVEEIKNAYGIPLDFLATNDLTTSMVWGPGTFGYEPAALAVFASEQAPLINLQKIRFDTDNHGTPGGDNWYEGTLDVQMISSFGLNATTLVSNTNTSASTEETTGFGAALLDFVSELSSRPTVPHVLSMSLGSLSAMSCSLLCSSVSSMGITSSACLDYISKQRQVCMFLSAEQTERINVYFMALGLRGVTVMGASGDGGSHFSFTAFSTGGDDDDIATALNEVSCSNQLPVFPTESPYVLSVGGEMWDGSSKNPVTWNAQGKYGSGSGFSLQFPAPAHQQAAVSAYLQKDGMPPSSSFNAANRAYPDVAAVGVSGTSQSCPITAGIWALITDIRLNKGLPPLGYVATRIYQIAGMHPGEAFEDIIGGNSCTSCDNGFPATDGWDANTGFGRPKWDGLVKYFGSDDWM